MQRRPTLSDLLMIQLLSLPFGDYMKVIRSSCTDHEAYVRFLPFWQTPGLSFQMKGNRHVILVQCHVHLLYTVDWGHPHHSVSDGEKRDLPCDNVLKANKTKLQIPNDFDETFGKDAL